MRLIDADALWMDVIHSMDYCDDILEFIERQPTIEPEIIYPETIADLISRQAAIEAVSKECMELRGVFGRCEDALKALPSAQPEDRCGECDAWNRYKNYPSAQLEIIRCKDCMYWDKSWANDWGKDYHYCIMVDSVRKGDFYCADAEWEGE